MREDARSDQSETERNIRTLRHGEERKHLEMLNLCFNPWGSEKDWKKRYVQFPNFDATANVIVVEENGKWAGGGTAWFRDALLSNGKQTMVYTPGDLYTSPDFRGKGTYSTAMTSLNKLARDRGATLGFAFPSIYRIASLALHKYGFTDIFYPKTRIFVVNYEKFIDYILSHVREAYLPRKYNNLKLKLVVSYRSKAISNEVSKTFRVVNGQLQELGEVNNESENYDLTVKTRLDTLLKVSSRFYLGKRSFVWAAITALLQRRLGIRFSMKFLRILVSH